MYFYSNELFVTNCYLYGVKLELSVEYMETMCFEDTIIHILGVANICVPLFIIIMYTLKNDKKCTCLTVNYMQSNDLINFSMINFTDGKNKVFKWFLSPCEKIKTKIN